MQDFTKREFLKNSGIYRIVRLKMDGKLNSIKHFKLLMSMYRNMKREEKRFGFGIDFEQMNRLLKAL